MRPFVKALRSLDEKGFDFRGVLLKAAWKAYNDAPRTRNIQSSDFQTLIEPFYHALFQSEGDTIGSVVDTLRESFRSASEFEQFLADTLVILLNQYTKSFYNTRNGWNYIRRFTLACEQLIDFTQDHHEEESFFIFEDTLIDEIESMRQKGVELAVLNTYLGVPIQYPATIVHTGPRSITLKLHPLQETAALIQNGIYLIQVGEDERDVYASVSPLHTENDAVVVLSRFDRLETSLFHRQSIRVRPKEPYSLLLSVNGIALKCNLYDLSLGGMAVTSFLKCPLKQNDTIEMKVPEEITEKLSSITARMVFHSSYEGGHKYHFKMELSQAQEDELSKYISRREKEIIKMLREEAI